MLILLVGQGGREHALAWKLKQNPQVKLAIAPGNGGLASLGDIYDIKADNIPAIVELAIKIRPDLVIIGPEAPLALGLADQLRKEGFKVFGPSKSAARIEASKSFAKDFMLKYNLPTAAYKTFIKYEQALDYIKQAAYPLVIKADGLASGKGVLICQDLNQAEKALSSVMLDKEFGDAGNLVLIEEFLVGEEASCLCFTDGETIFPMPAAQDHKQINDGDQGPNTGGMGAYSPAPIVDEKMEQYVLEHIFKPAVAGLKKEGANFCGVLYAGLMITDKGPKLLEFNARFGDPETQPLLMRLESDLSEICLLTAEGRLHELKEINWNSKAAVCVVLSSQGYPGDYIKGDEINGINEAETLEDVKVFISGAKLQKTQETNHLVTDGGRVLSVTALGDTLKQAVNKVYEAVKMVNFKGAHYRHDIAFKALKRNIND